MLHSGQCVYSGTHYLVARLPSMWAIRPKPQLSLSRDLSYNISVNLPRLYGTPSDTDCARAQKEHGDGVCTSHSPSLNPFRIGTQV
ncbi:Uncharacterised protein [Raoultella terrigena]|uniref:Uncharacterized protein n=1 Tax=Raoultella terrigena TaxID=577 RepID=A0A4U9D158_RAOTE|nr:Uncharacterised protein [Raoultella terrigena]